MRAKRIISGILIQVLANVKACKCLKDCTCWKSLVDNIVVTCGEIVGTSENAVISPSNGINN